LRQIDLRDLPVAVLDANGERTRLPVGKPDAEAHRVLVVGDDLRARVERARPAGLRDAGVHAEERRDAHGAHRVVLPHARELRIVGERARRGHALLGGELVRDHRLDREEARLLRRQLADEAEAREPRAVAAMGARRTTCFERVGAADRLEDALRRNGESDGLAVRDLEGVEPEDAAARSIGAVCWTNVSLWAPASMTKLSFDT
jgi:hypothetical protein